MPEVEEETFGVKIRDADAEKIAAVRAAMKYIEKHAKSVKQ